MSMVLEYYRALELAQSRPTYGIKNLLTRVVEQQRRNFRHGNISLAILTIYQLSYVSTVEGSTPQPNQARDILDSSTWGNLGDLSASTKYFI